MKCRLCNNELNHQEVTLCGTMYGTKGNFEYFLCGKCGSLQIIDCDVDLSAYYNTDTYYAFNMDQRSLKNEMLMKQMKHQLFGKSFLGTLVQMIYPVEYRFYGLISPQNDSVLDVGCGQGEALVWLQKLGYRDLTGLDPYIKEEIHQNCINIYSTDLLHYKSDKKYKLITFIHSFEHLPNVEENLRRAVELIEDDGYLVIQLPFLSHYYYSKYRQTLYTLDPPRHIFIPTYEGMQELMSRHGLSIVKFTTKFDPAIPVMARNVRKGTTERNQGTKFISGALSSLLSLPLRYQLHKEEDGAIATFIFRKGSRNDET